MSFNRIAIRDFYHFLAFLRDSSPLCKAFLRDFCHFLAFLRDSYPYAALLYLPARALRGPPQRALCVETTPCGPPGPEPLEASYPLVRLFEAFCKRLFERLPMLYKRPFLQSFLKAFEGFVRGLLF